MHTPIRVYLGLLLASTLACEGKGAPAGTDPIDDSASDSGPSSTSSTSGSPALTTTGTTDVAGSTGTTDVAGSTGMTSGSETFGDTTAMTTGTSGPGEPRPCEGEAVPIDAEMLSYLESQIVPPGEDSDGTTGEDSDPTLIYVRFASQAFTCADPHARLACGHNWELSLRIPTGSQSPGLYSLQWNGDVFGFSLSNGIDLGNDECDGGGGGVTGTLEIVSIDADNVTGRLCHVTAPGLDGPIELDGSFVAPRCPQ